MLRSVTAQTGAEAAWEQYDRVRTGPPPAPKPAGRGVRGGALLHTIPHGALAEDPDEQPTGEPELPDQERDQVPGHIPQSGIRHQAGWNGVPGEA